MRRLELIWELKDEFAYTSAPKNRFDLELTLLNASAMVCHTFWKSDNGEVRGLDRTTLVRILGETQ
jgi:hypothetical protein